MTTSFATRQDRSSCNDLVQILFCSSFTSTPTHARFYSPSFESCLFSAMLLSWSHSPSFPLPPRPWPLPLTSGGPGLYISLYSLSSLLASSNPAEGSSSTGMHCPAGPLPTIAVLGPAPGVGELGIREHHFISSGDALNFLPVAFGKI